MSSCLGRILNLTSIIYDENWEKGTSFEPQPDYFLLQRSSTKAGLYLQRELEQTAQ
jgi:hypothetical protein